MAQHDQDFTWIVVDDAGDDGTAEWLARTGADAPFPIMVLVNANHLGKAASLNAAFDGRPNAHHIIVDSDDVLLPPAIDNIRRHVRRCGDQPGIGALFLSYINEEGDLLGGPGPGQEVLAYRSELDRTLGKYDGCVVYLVDVVRRYRYPQFPGEKYVGPTVLQLAMEPEYRICFIGEVVGVAQYRPDGLTAAGRQLRVQSPLGMMYYEALHFRRNSTMRECLKHAMAYWAYNTLTSGRAACYLEETTVKRRCASLMARAPGRLLGRWWGRHGTA